MIHDVQSEQRLHSFIKMQSDISCRLSFVVRIIFKPVLTNLSFDGHRKNTMRTFSTPNLHSISRTSELNNDASAP